MTHNPSSKSFGNTYLSVNTKAWLNKLPRGFESRLKGAIGLADI